MTWLLGIKIYALCSLLFSAGWAVCGWRFNKRRERFDAEWAAISEPKPIKAEPTIWS